MVTLSVNDIAGAVGTVREAAAAAQASGDLCRVFDYPDSGRGHIWGLPVGLTVEAVELLARPEVKDLA